LTIGITSYRDKNLTLDYGTPDALAILQQLSQASAGVFEQISGYKLTDEAATAPGSCSLLDTLRQTRPEDIVAIYLAGHGEIIDKRVVLPAGRRLDRQRRSAGQDQASRRPCCATR